MESIGKVYDAERGTLWFDGCRSVDVDQIRRIDGEYLVMPWGHVRVGEYIAGVAEKAMNARAEVRRAA